PRRVPGSGTRREVRPRTRPSDTTALRAVPGARAPRPRRSRGPRRRSPRPTERSRAPRCPAVLWRGTARRRHPPAGRLPGPRRGELGARGPQLIGQPPLHPAGEADASVIRGGVAGRARTVGVTELPRPVAPTATVPLG